MPDLPPLVVFLTDYGRSDPFVGLCHATVAAEAPRARVIDLTHDVAPFDVAAGALLLHDCLPSLPEGVLLAVVDPGVGTDRLAVALRAGGRWLVGPDNGLLLPAATRLGGVTAAWSLRRIRAGAARTFDGRDVFAPVAARLAVGVPAARLGDPVDPDTLVPLSLPPASVDDGALTAVVLRRDRFGNLLLSAVAADLAAVGWQRGRLLELAAPGSRAPVTVTATFGDVAPGALGLLPDAFGRLQVAAREADAGALLGCGPGARLRFRAV